MEEVKEDVELENEDEFTPTEEGLDYCESVAPACADCKYSDKCKCQCCRPKGLFKRIAYFFTHTKWYRKRQCKKYDKENIAKEMRRLDFELELATANGDVYSNSCIENAVECYKAMYKVLYEAGHSGLSHSVTVNLIKRLLDEKPLTAITDSDFEEMDIQIENGDSIQYNCTRYSSLFKDVYKDGKVVYSDLDRCVNVDEVCELSYGNFFAEHKLIELGLIPSITIPYLPENRPYRIYTLDVHYLEIYDELQDSSYRYIDYFITPQLDKVKVDKLYKIQHINEFDDEYIEVVDKEEKKKVVKLLKSQIARHKKETEERYKENDNE